MPRTDLDDMLFGRYCCAKACTVKRDPQFIMCVQHWAMVPPLIQRLVIRRLGAYLNDRQQPGRRGKLYNALLQAKNAVEDEESRREAQAVRKAART